MADQSESQTSIIVSSEVRQSHLEGTWIGLAAAIEWIVFREQSMDLDEFEQLHDEAMRAFINALIDAEPEDAANAVQGYNDLDPAPSMKAVDPGLWPLTAATELEYGRKNYILLVVDEVDGDEYEDENARANWAGQLVGADGFRIRNLRVRCDFILRHWPKSSKGTNAKQPRKSFSQAELERWIDVIFAEAEKEKLSLNQEQVICLAKIKIPQVTQAPILEIYKRKKPSYKKGPSGPRIPNKRAIFEKFQQKMRLLELRN